MPDLALSDAQDLVRDVKVIVPFGNSDHNANKFSIYVNRVLPKIKPFRRGDFSEMKQLVKKKLKRKGKSVRSFQEA